MRMEEFADIVPFVEHYQERGWIIYLMGNKIYAVTNGVVGQSFDNVEDFMQFVKENDLKREQNI